MKATIYALVDPNTHQVRYVGRTNQTAQQRYRHHLGAANRGTAKPVYDWIRSLHPSLPVLVILQEGIDAQAKIKRGGVWLWSVAQAAETKWMKRFERSQLLCVIPRDTEPYRTLINVRAFKKR